MKEYEIYKYYQCKLILIFQRLILMKSVLLAIENPLVTDATILSVGMMALGVAWLWCSVKARYDHLFVLQHQITSLVSKIMWPIMLDILLLILTFRKRMRLKCKTNLFQQSLTMTEQWMMETSIMLLPLKLDSPLIMRIWFNNTFKITN